MKNKYYEKEENQMNEQEKKKNLFNFNASDERMRLKTVCEQFGSYKKWCKYEMFINQRRERKIHYNEEKTKNDEAVENETVSDFGCGKK